MCRRPALPGKYSRNAASRPVFYAPTARQRRRPDGWKSARREKWSFQFQLAGAAGITGKCPFPTPLKYVFRCNTRIYLLKRNEELNGECF